MMKWILPLACSLLSFATTIQNVSARAWTEREILQEFYKETGGASWNVQTGWEDNSDNVCEWYGIVCEGEPEDGEGDASLRRILEEDPGIVIPHSDIGQVKAIRLKENNLIGRVPPSLWELPNLRIIVLSFNNVDIAFTGESLTLVELHMQQTATDSLTGISRFPNLMSLHMSGTSLGRVSFPTELLRLKNMRMLHMASCELEGPVPPDLNQLTNLIQFNVHDNDLTGRLPDGVAAMTSLQELTLSKNHFEGPLPTWLQNLSKLSELYLEENQLTGTILAFNTQVDLRKIYLDNNEFTGNIPVNLLASVQVDSDDDVVRVNLDYNRLGQVVPDSLDALSEIPLKLSLTGNQYTSFETAGTLCDNVKWMDGNVGTFGCNAILCPPNTASILGRQTPDHTCDSCESAQYMGQETCLDQDDHAALRAIYLETGGRHWHNNDGWMVDDNVCDWFGVTCHTEGQHVGRVRRLELPNNGLIGAIPDIIYALDALTTLDLSWNSIEFSFVGIEATMSLHVINIGHTDTTNFEGIDSANTFFRVFLADHLRLDGTIPKEVFLNTNLEILSLANCGLTGSIPDKLGDLKTLHELYLWGNELRGAIPNTVSNLQDLKILSLAKNQLTGTLPEGLETLARLKAFTIKDQVSKGGGLTGDILAFQYNEALTNLHLDGNKFVGSVPETFLSSVSADTTVICDLSSNMLTGTVPGTLSRFDQMDLFVQNNLITSLHPALCAMDDWMYGSVGNFGCDAILCPAYTASPQGRKVYDNLGCTDCSNSDLDNVLGLVSCSGKDEILTERQILLELYDVTNGPSWTHKERWSSEYHFCEWFGISCDDAKSVVAVVLGSNNLNGPIPTEIFSLPNLKRLSLFDNTIQFSFEGIEKAQNLRTLVLDNTGLKSVTGISNARGLTELNLGSNKIRGKIPNELASLNNLQSLLLSNNYLTGTLPEWLGKLDEVNTLMLENNKLNGKILDFGHYTNIALLNLANNRLTGTIPKLFLLAADRDAKVFVDLSKNQLTGTVPRDLNHLNRLSIHLTDNRIDAIDGDLCRMEGWNDYAVQEYGCNGILCPVGTYSTNKGRQSTDQNSCQTCHKAQFMGATNCSSAWRLLTSMSVLGVMIGTTMSLVL